MFLVFLVLCLGQRCILIEAQPAHSVAHRCCLNETLTVGLPPATFEPFWTYSSDQTYQGLLPDVLDSIATETGITLTYLPDPNFHLQNPYGALKSGERDLTLSLLAGPVAPQTFATDGTGPLVTLAIFWNRYRGVVYQTSSNSGLWAFLEPFSLDLWVALLCFVPVSGESVHCCWKIMRFGAQLWYCYLGGLCKRKEKRKLGRRSYQRYSVQIR